MSEIEWDPEELSRLVGLHQRRVESLLQRLCRDEDSRDCGGFIQADTGHADGRNSIYDGLELFAAYLSPRSTHYYGQGWLWDLLQLHLAFIRRRQQDDGTVDMGLTGVGDACEVGFTLPGACSIYALARKSGLPGAGEIADTLSHYVQRGAAALRQGVPYTANHRWAAHAGPLAIANHYFPHPDNAAVIEDLLDDGIDMDADGLYLHERSSIYDNVANWGLLYLADYWNRADLRDLVASNLRFTLKMIQPCGESETLLSYRQDRGEEGRFAGDYIVARRMASMYGDGEFAWLAQRNLDRACRTGNFCLFIPALALLEEGKLDLRPVPPSEPQWRFELRGRQTPIWRYRQDDVAITAVADSGGHYFDLLEGPWPGSIRSDAILSFHHGKAILDAIKFRWGLGVMGFRPETITYLDSHTWCMTFTDPGWQHVAHFRPGNKAVARQIYSGLKGQLAAQWQGGRLSLHLQIGGRDDVPVNVQLLLRAGQTLTAGETEGVVTVPGGRTFATGEAYTVRSASDCITITGLPASVHRMSVPDSRSIPSAADQRCHRLIGGYLTPIDIHFDLSAKDAPPCEVNLGRSAHPQERVVAR